MNTQPDTQPSQENAAITDPAAIRENTNGWASGGAIVGGLFALLANGWDFGKMLIGSLIGGLGGWAIANARQSDTQPTPLSGPAISHKDGTVDTPVADLYRDTAALSPPQTPKVSGQGSGRAP